MATTLPPINHGGGTTPEYAKSPSRDGSKLKLDGMPARGRGNKEKDLEEKRRLIRKLQPRLTRNDIAIYRNTYKHTLCLDMLQEGFHLSFQELYDLITRQEDERLRAGPDSVMWTQVMLKDEYNKLDMLKQYLTAAELAQRKEDYRTVYQARLELAKYFRTTGDKWLSDHFYETCLATSMKVMGQGGTKLQADGHLNVGLALVESGDYFTAAEHFESYHALAASHREWMKDDVISYYTDSCMKLCEVYTCIGNEVEAKDLNSALSFMTKALDMASESGEKVLEGEASYRLGMAYDKSGDQDTAIELLTTFLNACKETGNEEGFGRACDAMAKAYQRQGRIEECIDYLQQFVAVAEKTGQEQEYSKACHNLGNIYNLLGKYQEASEYFSKAYNISRAVGAGGSVQVNRVQLGIAMAHRAMLGMSNHIVKCNPVCIERLLDWKSTRSGDLERPVANGEAQSFPDKDEATYLPVQVEPTEVESTTSPPEE